MIAFWALLKGLPWRAIGAVALVLAVAWLGFVVSGWREDAKGRAAAEARTAEIARQAANAMDELAKRHREALRASQGLQDELSQLRSQRDAAPPAPVLRVCRRAPVSAPGTEGRAPAGPDGAGAASGALQEETRFDTRALYDEADRADELAARLRSLQKWAEDASK